MEFELIRSARRRRVAFRFEEEGKLVVLAPAELPLPEIERIVELNALKIRSWRRRSLFRPAAPVKGFTEGELFPLFDRQYPLHLSSRLLLFDNAFLVMRGTQEEIKAQLETLYRRLARQLLPEKCAQFAKVMGVEPASVGITGAETRWGSCSSRKHLSFCWKLMLVPEKLADYVVCHELAHLREMNHSSRFWAVVASVIPDWKERRAQLNAFPVIKF